MKVTPGREDMCDRPASPVRGYSGPSDGPAKRRHQRTVRGSCGNAGPGQKPERRQHERQLSNGKISASGQGGYNAIIGKIQGS